MPDTVIKQTSEPPVVRPADIPEQTQIRLREAVRKEFESQKKQTASHESIVLGKEASHVAATANEETLAQYAKRGHQLFHRFLREKELPHETQFSDIDARSLSVWLVSLKPTIKASTWRFYRASMYHFLNARQDDGVNVEQAMHILERDAIIRSRDAVSGNKRNRGTLLGTEKRSSSSLKLKKIPEKDIARILAWLRMKSRSQYATSLGIWLRAGILCGLRPSEWKMTHIEEVRDESTVYNRRVWLYVICAKATNGRGFGVSRTLDISTFDNESLSIVKKMSSLGAEWFSAGTFTENQDSCSHLLARCCRQLWPRRKYRVSLYSARHQAIANWKALGMSQAEISVLAGHASLATAAERYGRRTSGWSSIKFSPVPVKEELTVALEREALANERRLSIKQATPVVKAPAEQAPAKPTMQPGF